LRDRPRRLSANVNPGGTVTIRAQHDEVDQERQQEKEGSQRNKNPAGIKEKPNAPHGFFS
jgi:hypothetical protein